jgi:hypothetical protein
VFAVLLLALLPSSHVNADLVYGGGTETGSRFNPGAGAITYMNCFTALSGGQNVLTLDQVQVGIRRGPQGGSLVDVGLNIYAADMTFDGTNFGRGTNNLIFSTTLAATPSTGFVTQLVTAPGLSTVLNLETASNPGLGGWWIGVEFTGPNGANSINGWRVVNDPTTGASINAFGLFNNAGSGIFEAFFAFGTPPGSSPSRFLVNVEGSLSAVPEPSGLFLVSLAAGAVGMVRSRRPSPK